MSIVLIRPFSFLAFVPLLFVLPLTRKFIIGSFIAALVYLLFVVTSPFQLKLYTDYNKFVKESTNMHQGKPITMQVNAKNPGFRQIEGFDIAWIRTSKLRDRIHSRNEHGNVFVLYSKLFGKPLPPQWLLAGSMLATFLIISIFFLGTRQRSLAQCMLVGFIIYAILEMFLPIHRHQYNSVQFLFPLLLFGMHFKHLSKPYAWLIIAGLLLNILKFEIFPMKNTIGELLMLAGFFLAVFFNQQLALSCGRYEPAKAPGHA